jgi:hypothetical protein
MPHFTMSTASGINVIDLVSAKSSGASTPSEREPLIRANIAANIDRWERLRSSPSATTSEITAARDGILKWMLNKRVLHHNGKRYFKFSTNPVMTCVLKTAHQRTTEKAIDLGSPEAIERDSQIPDCPRLECDQTVER